MIYGKKNKKFEKFLRKFKTKSKRLSIINRQDIKIIRFKLVFLKRKKSIQFYSSKKLKSKESWQKEVENVFSLLLSFFIKFFLNFFLFASFSLVLSLLLKMDFSQRTRNLKIHRFIDDVGCPVKILKLHFRLKNSSSLWIK